MNKNRISQIIFFFCTALLFVPQTFSQTSFAPIVKSENLKVVHINVLSRRADLPNNFNPLFERLFPNIPKNKLLLRESGSGFIISADGYVVTNSHVVANAEEVEVKLYDQTSYKATIKGTDVKTDLALLKIEAKDLPFVKFGDSDELQIGDWLLAIGNPLGLDNTVTAGILSAKGRELFGGTAYGQFLQTDTAINFGNSGGPLFNTKGEVIGINTAIIVSGQNLAFAIPSNLAKKIITQLKKSGSVVRGWLGVGIENLDDDKVTSLSLKSKKGVAVNLVGENSPAEKAGFKEFDVIINYDGKLIPEVKVLQQYVAETPPGKKVRVKIIRDGKEKTLSANIALLDLQTNAKDKAQGGEFQLGMKLRTINEKVAKENNLSLQQGLLVRDVDPASVAAEKNIRPGDVIVKVNAKKVTTLQDFKRIVETVNSSYVTLLVNRRGYRLLIALPK